MFAGWARLLLDAVAPRRCAGCDAVSDGPICAGCDRSLATMSVPRPRRLRHGIAYAAFEFEEPVRAALHRGKFGGDRGALEALGDITARRLDGERGRPRASIPDAVVAVPLGSRRRRQRSYNQAEVVARVLANARRVPLLEGLRRLRETSAQSSRDEEARRINVSGAFAWTGTPIDAAHLWLVDDVLTTGATVEAASAVLSAAGASRIDVVVVAVVP
jgi:ComF family protein